MSSNQNEVLLDTKSFLVSETDEKGIIKFANDQFCDISGYSQKELIGQPHNIIRHQDMPKILFQELWETIQKGKKWRGFVKNKRKNGGYYWVFTTVFPYTSCDGTKGYISCRRMASRDEIKQYETSYKTMR